MGLHATLFWLFLRNESAGEICGVFAQILCDFGPPGEIVADNGASFRSNEFLKLLEDWNIKVHFRCAYRPREMKLWSVIIAELNVWQQEPIRLSMSVFFLQCESKEF